MNNSDPLNCLLSTKQQTIVNRIKKAWRIKNVPSFNQKNFLRKVKRQNKTGP